MRRAQILLTNDDGIRSPGLWAAANALSRLGFVHVVAPLEQSSGTGRSLPTSSNGTIQSQSITVNGQGWTAFAVEGTPAQAVLHAILEILPEKPDLVVAGINYGENVGSGITISGTIGAALEGAAFGIPSLAISLETEVKHHYSYSAEVDFSTAAYFTQYFSKQILTKKLPHDVDVLKVDIPSVATLETPWRITRLSRLRYFEPVPPNRTSWKTPGRMGYRSSNSSLHDQHDTDSYTLQNLRLISVTPLSLDLTSRVDFSKLEDRLKPE